MLLSYEIQEKKKWVKEFYPCTHPDRITKAIQEGLRRDKRGMLDHAYNLGADETVLTLTGFTLIHEAIMSRNYSIADIMALLDKGVDPTVVTSCGTTTIMLAVENFQNDLVPVLVAHGVDALARDCFGRDACMRGIIAGNGNVVECLNPFGAVDEHAFDQDGRRALELAMLHGNARAAYAIGGATASLVPGYISPTVQSFRDTLGILHTIAFHFLDVISDWTVFFSLAGKHNGLAAVSLVFIMLPIAIMAVMPFQSITQRVITLLQVRIVYEVRRIVAAANSS